MVLRWSGNIRRISCTKASSLSGTHSNNNGSFSSVSVSYNVLPGRVIVSYPCSARTTLCGCCANTELSIAIIEVCIVIYIKFIFMINCPSFSQMNRCSNT